MVTSKNLRKMAFRLSERIAVEKLLDPYKEKETKIGLMEVTLMLQKSVLKERK